MGNHFYQIYKMIKTKKDSLDIRLLELYSNLIETKEITKTGMMILLTITFIQIMDVNHM